MISVEQTEKDVKLLGKVKQQKTQVIDVTETLFSKMYAT